MRYLRASESTLYNQIFIIETIAFSFINFYYNTSILLV